MTSEILSIIVLTVVAVVLLTIAIFAIIYDLRKKKRTLKATDKDDWLMKGFQEGIYNLCYKKSTSDSLCGINRYDYDRWCKIIHVPNNFKAVVACRLEAILSLALCAYLSIAMKSNMLLSLLFMFIGIAAGFVLWVLPYRSVKDKVDEKLFHIQDDLPRFLSLLEKAMDLPIDQAIKVTASQFESPLSEDLLDSINKVSLGANGWQETLIDLARVYDLEDFNDLVLEIVNSYEQGINIRPLVDRKAYEVEQNRLYAVESHDSKIKTLIFMPIIFLKVVPLMVLIAMPMLTDFMH